MALTNLALFGGAFFTPVLVGKITHTIGWEWTFYMIAIFSGLLLPFVFLFVPETAFRRDTMLNNDLAGEGPAVHEALDKHTSGTINQSGLSDHRKDKADHQGRTSPSKYTSPPKATFLQSLQPFNGRKTDENLFKLIFRPFPLFFHPAIFWACLIQGTLIGWTVVIGVVLAALFIGPPLWFEEVKTGYMYAGPFIGAILGFILSGLLSDWSTKFMIRQNKGLYEPEFRILLVFPQLVFGCVGLYGFGATANHVKHWIWPELFFSLEVMGMVIGAVASALYIVDAHRGPHSLRLAQNAKR